MYLQWVKAIENPHRGRIPPSPRSNRVEGTGRKERSKHQKWKGGRGGRAAGLAGKPEAIAYFDGRTWQTQTRIVQVNRFWLKHVEVWTPITSNSFKFKAIPGFRQVLQPLQKPWNLFPSPILITVAGLLSESTGETTRSTKLPSIQVPRWLTSFTASIWWFGPCWRSRSCHLADLALLVVGRRVLQVSQLIFKRSWAEPCNKSHTRQF